MSYQQRQSPKQQISEFVTTFMQTIISTALAFITVGCLSLWALKTLEMNLTLEPIFEVTLLPAYFATAWMGLVLRLTSNNLQKQEEVNVDAGEAAEETVEDIEEENPHDFETLVENAGQLFKGYASMAYISLIVLTGTAVGLVVTELAGPLLGVVAAIAMPTLELKAGDSRLWFATPSNFLAFPLFAAMIPVTVATVAIALILGTFLGISQVLKAVSKEVLKAVIELFSTSYVETPALDPFRKTFRSRPRR